MTRTLSAALALAVFTLPLDALEAEELAGRPAPAAALDARSAGAPAAPEIGNAPDYEEEYEEWFEEPTEPCGGEDDAELERVP